eukprot:scaffold118490_cov31-Tisochrysis_lutea.AAC.2
MRGDRNTAASPSSETAPSQWRRRSAMADVRIGCVSGLPLALLAHLASAPSTSFSESQGDASAVARNSGTSHRHLNLVACVTSKSPRCSAALRSAGAAGRGNSAAIPAPPSSAVCICAASSPMRRSRLSRCAQRPINICWCPTLVAFEREGGWEDLHNVAGCELTKLLVALICRSSRERDAAAVPHDANTAAALWRARAIDVCTIGGKVSHREPTSLIEL